MAQLICACDLSHVYGYAWTRRVGFSKMVCAGLTLLTLKSIVKHPFSGTGVEAGRRQGLLENLHRKSYSALKGEAGGRVSPLVS